MKAITLHCYGSADVLGYEDVDRPAPGDGQVLVRVRAASVNPVDWHRMSGTPYLARTAMGLREPKVTRLGADLAGEVEAVGSDVTQFRVGDQVFGTAGGALAEYACAREGALALKPANLTFEQAAAVPVAATTALQGLRDKGQLQPGQRVLINGAAGGVGTFAVQIARAFGAKVTGVCSTRNVDMVRAIGAHHVVDYTQQDFTQSGERYDVMLDTVGNRSLAACRRVMSRGGIYVVVGGPDGRWLGPLARGLKAALLSPFVSQSLVMFLASVSQGDLAVLRELVEAGKVTPVIDRRYPLSRVPEAVRYLEAGHARGKVVITLDRESEA